MIFLCLLLFGLVFWTFFPSVQCGFITIDDAQFVRRNPHIAFTWANLVWAACNPVAANWHPLTLWSFVLDHQLYGLKPWGYHLTNVWLHAVSSVLVFLVLRRMTGATWRSLMVAGLFGLHPQRVQSVTWIFGAQGRVERVVLDVDAVGVHALRASADARCAGFA